MTMNERTQTESDSESNLDESTPAEDSDDRVPDDGDSRAQGRSRSQHSTSPEEVEEALAEAELTAGLDRLQEEFETLNDRHLRLAAEFTNYRRRAEQERTEVWARAQADLVRRFLDVLDDLQRVEDLDPTDPGVTVESIVEGVDLVEKKFLRVLEDAGTEFLSPADGEPFDPERMEAMMRVPTDDEAMDDHVAQVFLKGCVFQGHLVRPARVSVYKAD